MQAPYRKKMKRMMTYRSQVDGEAVYLAYYERVYNYIYSRLLQRETAEDLTADVFVAMLLHLNDFSGPEDGIVPWLCRIAHNTVVDYHKKARVCREISVSQVPETPDPGAGKTEGDDSLESPDSFMAEKILRTLSAEEREFLGLRYGLELSGLEIADIKGISVNAVNLRYHRLLEKCRRIAEETKSEKNFCEPKDFKPVNRLYKQER